MFGGTRPAVGLAWVVELGLVLDRVHPVIASKFILGCAQNRYALNIRVPCLALLVFFTSLTSVVLALAD